MLFFITLKINLPLSKIYMRLVILLLSLFLSVTLCGQVNKFTSQKKSVRDIPTSTTNFKNTSIINNNQVQSDSSRLNKKNTVNDSVAHIDQYEILDRYNNRSTFDTILNIKKYYEMNYLRRDDFGLLPFSNDGLTYNVLNYSLIKNTTTPGLGFKARNFAYLDVDNINYYHVPTPTSEIFFRSAVKQGQNLDALLTTNTSQQLNFFIGYRGLRSLGSYINQLASNGNFRLGSSYNTKNNRYFFKAHLTVQDISNQENGGITDTDLFLSREAPFNNRERLNVYFRDAKSLFKGIRTYIDHQYNFINSKSNGIWLKHQFIYEYKTNSYTQTNANPVNSYNDGVAIDRFFGDSFSTAINDKLRNTTVYNKISLSYSNDKLGELAFNADHFNYNYYYNSQLNDENGALLVPNKLEDDIVTIGGSYLLNKEKFDAKFGLRQSVVGASMSEISGEILFTPFQNYLLHIKYQYLNKIPDLNYQMFQSGFVSYNWKNEFSNEKINQLDVNLNTPWLNITGNYQIIKDKIYFANTDLTTDAKGRNLKQIIAPKQFSEAIHYLSISAQKEFKFKKFALDNSVLFQQVVQNEEILNVPTIVTRNTFYFTDYLFKKALLVQTGITFKYFTEYYANGYNPVVGDFYVQNQQKIGNYPVFDFFINGKIKTARIYINVEHFNASLTGGNYFSAPNQPYREMRLRLGIVWDFFN